MGGVSDDEGVKKILRLLLEYAVTPLEEDMHSYVQILQCSNTVNYTTVAIHLSMTSGITYSMILSPRHAAITSTTA